MNKQLFRICLFCGFFSVALSLNAVPSELNPYYAFENALFGETADTLTLIQLYETATTSIKKIEQPYTRNLFAARADYLRGMLPLIPIMKASENDTKNKSPKIPDAVKKEMNTFLSIGLIYLEQAEQIRQTADTCVTKAQIIMMAGMSDNIFELIPVMKQVDELTKKAMQLEPQNVAALYMSATGKIMPPPPFGDVKKGLTEALYAASCITDETALLDAFNIYLLLARGYEKQRNKTDALLWLQKAEKIYPESVSLKQLRESLANLKSK